MKTVRATFGARFGGASLLALGLVIGAPALAQTATPEPELSADDAQTGQTDDIVVTARRVEERLQDVPIAITAFSGDTLIDKGATNIGDVAAFTPGFSTNIAGSNPTVITLQIRGQSTDEILATADPSVGTYVDEMYWARAYGLNTSLVDTANVQVLKGPQGTLFGRNTTGGAMILTTNDPKMSGYSGSVAVSYGRFNERTADVIINAPLAENFAVRGVAHVSRRDGWAYGVRHYNKATGLPDNNYLAPGLGEIRPDGSRFNNRDQSLARVKALWNVTDSTSLLVSGEWFSSSVDGPARQLLYKVNLNDSSSAGDNLAARTPILAYLDYYKNNPRATGADMFNCSYAVTSANCQDTLFNFNELHTDTKTQTYMAKLTSDLGFGQFKLIAGYRGVQSQTDVDIDGVAVLMHSTTIQIDLNQKSIEAQLTGSIFGGNADYAIGATYFTEDGVDRSYSLTTNPGGTRRNNATRNYGDIKNRSYGFYGQVSYRLTDALSFTGGLRYSNDAKGIEIRSANVGLNGQLQPLANIPAGAPAGSLQLNNPCNAAGSTALPLASAPNMRFDYITGATAANDCTAFRSDSFGALSWTAGLDYKVSQNVLLYAKVSRGYRSGGQNLRAFNDYQFVPFAPEHLTEQEVGFKGDFLDRAVRLNVSVYRNTLNDAQRNVNVNYGLVSNTVITNVARVRNKGFEADLTIRPVRGLSLTASGAYNDYKYLEYTDAGGDRRNDRSRYLPKYTFNLSAAYTTALTDRLTSSFNVDLSERGAMAGDRCTVSGPSACWAGSADVTGKTREQISKEIFDVTSLPALTTLNARVTFGLDNDAYTFAIWGRNILGQQKPQSSIGLLVPYRNYVTGDFLPPATYGITVTTKF
jgi:iron complex outermembrane receptor protein